MPLRAALAVCLCLLLGCSKEQFKSEAEELEYLTSISQPSVTQFHRKKELEAKADAVRRQASLADDRAFQAEEQARLNEEAAREKALEPQRKAERAAQAKAALEEAVEWENRFVAGTPKAADHYRNVVKDFPDTPEARAAQIRIQELEAAQK